MARSLLPHAIPPQPFPVSRQARNGVSGAARSWRFGPLGFAYVAALADAIAIVAAALAATLLRMAMFGGDLEGVADGLRHRTHRRGAIRPGGASQRSLHAGELRGSVRPIRTRFSALESHRARRARARRRRPGGRRLSARRARPVLFSGPRQPRAHARRARRRAVADACPRICCRGGASPSSDSSAKSTN